MVQFASYLRRVLFFLEVIIKELETTAFRLQDSQICACIFSTLIAI